ncbi:MAG TPA: universal stress protein [Thermomicrobiales bacterium]|nr:universal stress protein [Thermomicrobiales bacterium]
MSEVRRPTPEELLRRIGDEGGAQGLHTGRGGLHVFLGSAPGVGKTWAMLNEGRRLRDAGIDVVCGYVETHGRRETEAQIGDLELIPRKAVAYRGVIVEEMDVDAILAREPAVCLVDELAHTNAPGSERDKRWQDVELLRDAGISVITTLNIQHLESLNDIIESITGVRVRETLPDWLLDAPATVTLIDLDPETLRQRLRDGRIYPVDRAEAAMGQFFRAGNLTALRELALRRVAEGVEVALERYMADHQIAGPWAATETVLACFGTGPLASQVLRHAWRLARGLDASFVAVHATKVPLAELPDVDRRVIERDIELAEDLGAEVVIAQGTDYVRAILDIARQQNATQIVIGHSQRPRWHELLGRSLVTELIRHARGYDIHVVADRGTAPPPS